MVYFRRGYFAALLLTLAGSFAVPCSAEEKASPKPVVPVGVWKTTFGDEDLINTTVAPAYLTDAKTLEGLYKAWKLEGKAPEVDFKTEVVIVSVTPCSNVRVEATLSDKGDLKTLAVGNRDRVKGLRCVFTRIKTEGVNSINGKPFKE